MKQVKFCTNCSWGKPDQHSPWSIKCYHPVVNAKDPWILSSTNINGSSACDERTKGFFSACGMRGKLWKQK